MAKSIHDILLFYSQGSLYCNNVRQYISTINVPISFICIDSKTMRDKLSTINTLHVKGVPTLVVIYGSVENGMSVLDTAEIYEGDKVMAWLRSNFEPKRIAPQPKERRQEPRPPSREHGEPHREPKERRHSEPHREPKEQHEPRRDVTKKAPQDSKRRKIDTVKALAKEMEEQRKKSLGIDDNGNTIKKRVDHEKSPSHETRDEPCDEPYDEPEEDVGTSYYTDDEEYEI